jgi:hypothetical protein
MAKYSMKKGGKEVGSASIYAEPHTMSGEKLNPSESISYKTDPNSMSAVEATPGGMPARRVSGGNPNRDDVKTTGMKQRGSGCATKGFTSRGPMA